ncbi:MAG: hypothetical protein A3J38_01750 [Gammaproteobacteria bacterium RIFCSPHIGHO2_12_FULL_45_9]|nr:MAG: hypothetical protein A3J38_01750 [Gammaproteobacteria bacterium RIFCSPHIGHO2_12_FULL_45_9]
MAIKDALKVSRKTFFNPTAWFGYESFKANNRIIWQLIRGLFYPVQVTRQETFTEAVARLQLTDEDIRAAEENYHVYAWFFLILAVPTFILGVYISFHHAVFLSLLLSFASTALLLSQAFKYHFWAFQIKHRKLGCTYREWRRGYPDQGSI